MNTIHFKPGAELTFRSVIALREKLCAALMNSAKERFNLDLSDVQYCDSAGLALLIEARKLCRKNNKIFEVTGMSDETQSLAEFCGVKDILQTV